MTIVTIKAKVFGKIQSVRAAVDADGTVRVWDSVAGHYTLCHNLSTSARERARKLAAISE